MKVKRYRQIYEALNPKGEVIARGLSEDVSMVIGCKRTTICGSALSGNPIFGKYTIKKLKRVYTEYETQDNPQMEKAKAKRDKEILENQLWNLERNGNNIVVKDLDWHLDYFREHGFDCKATKTTHTNEKRRKESYYIVEVNDAERGRKGV